MDNNVYFLSTTSFRSRRFLATAKDNSQPYCFLMSSLFTLDAFWVHSKVRLVSPYTEI